MVGIYYSVYVAVAGCCCVAGKETSRYQELNIINHLYHHQQLTSSNSSCTSLLLVVVRVAVVVVAAAGCGGSGDGHLYVPVVLVVKFYLARTGCLVKGFCADAHRLTMKNQRYPKAIAQLVVGLTQCIRFNKFK